MVLHSNPDRSIRRPDAGHELGLHQGQDVVCVDQVSFAYTGHLAIEGVTLHVKQGTKLGIVGPNGSGKTTLLKLMLGSLIPDSGEVRVLGLSPQDACARGDLVGYVPQRHLLDWSFPVSVRHVVEMGLAGKRGLIGRLSQAEREWATELLQAVGMAHLANEPIGALSGGQQQRVFVARALVAKPQVLFLDEPMTGIDQAAQESLATLLEQVRARFSLTMVMVSHNLRAVIATCDRIACLNRTLHYHDRPASLSRDVLLRVFQCDVDALLDGHSHEG
jgi:zinc transport system ATP-binding protein